MYNLISRTLPLLFFLMDFKYRFWDSFQPRDRDIYKTKKKVKKLARAGQRGTALILKSITSTFVRKECYQAVEAILALHNIMEFEHKERQEKTREEKRAKEFHKRTIMPKGVATVILFLVICHYSLSSGSELPKPLGDMTRASLV